MNFFIKILPLHVMKKYFLVYILIGLTLLSCGSDDDSLQKVDQKLQIFMKDSAGNDLVNPVKVGSYSGIIWNDELASSDIANVNFTRSMLSDSTFYMEYLAGATREFVSESSDGSKIYRSEIQVSLTKKLSATQFAPVDIDTLQIFYRMTPSVFEVSQVYFNKSLKFTKIPDQPNVVTIIK
ncbi:hypothetical protein [Chryseobacterium oryzae]|uniref:Uncharacterized protein n=1 Tax=Chryseobacterium oryzae TaxID=2929799 RepID=A0ABY4BGK6_9FLAO|nr:hypothetical protein [Chryseobacterium oryzae]UOE38034.1 hypothetical protein MTP08_13420 [Chryseobacterium oryzae]